MNLQEIAEWVIKEHPDSLFSSNYSDFYKHMENWELTKELRDFFCGEIIGMCRCGIPEETYSTITSYLDLINKRTNKDLDFDKFSVELKKLFGCEYISDNGLLQFMAYILDDKGFTDHGSSINACCITNIGEMLLFVLKEEK